MEWKELILPAGMAIGAIIVGVFKGIGDHVARRSKRTNPDGGDNAAKDNGGAVVCNKHGTDIEIIKTEVREIQRQIDELFSRMRLTEEHVNETRGYLTGLRDALTDILARLRDLQK